MHALIDDRGNERHPPDGRDLNAVEWLRGKVRASQGGP